MKAVESVLETRDDGINGIRPLARAMAALLPRQNAESWRKTLQRYRDTDPPDEFTATTIAKAAGIPREELPALPVKSRLQDVAEAQARLESRLAEWFADRHEAAELLVQSLASLRLSVDELAQGTPRPRAQARQAKGRGA